MCWEDMKHYRNAFAQTQEVAQAASTTLAPNANRIRLIVAGTYNAVANRTTVFASQAALAPVGVASNGKPTLIMRIEDYGQIIMGPFVISNAGGNGPCTVTEIISREPIEPFIRPNLGATRSIDAQQRAFSDI